MREKKSWKKNYKKMNEDVKVMLEAKHDEEELQAQIKKLPIDQLFSINANKNDKKREKLKADRFKQQCQKGVSLTETILIKRLKEKNPPQEQRIKKEEMDIWGTPAEKGTKLVKFEAFKGSHMPQVKAVLQPLPGQSFNPSAQAHKGVLNQVYIEEKTEIEKEKALSLKEQNKQTVKLFEAPDQAEHSASEESEEVDGDNIPSNKPIDRLKKKTKQDLNRQLAHKERVDKFKLTKEGKNIKHQVDIMDTLMRQVDIEARRQAKMQEQRQKEEQEERDRQEKIGVVTKPAVVGRFKYKMRKTDFQLEEELAPTLRQLKVQGTDDLLRERFDSVFRRNLIELDAPTKDLKRREQKRQYKFKERQGAAFGGTVAQKLHKKNEKLRRKNNDKESNAFLKNDLIMI